MTGAYNEGVVIREVFVAGFAVEVGAVNFQVRLLFPASDGAFVPLVVEVVVDLLFDDCEIGQRLGPHEEVRQIVHQGIEVPPVLPVFLFLYFLRDLVEVVKVLEVPEVAAILDFQSFSNLRSAADTFFRLKNSL